MDIIKDMDYARIVSDKKLKGSGLTKGDLIMVMANKVVPVKKSDPYLQRIVSIVARVVDGKVLIPSSKSDNKAYVIDPRNLEKVSEDEEKELKQLLEEQYGKTSIES